MARRAEEPVPSDRRRRQAAWATCIGALGLLVFTWPFLRVPPLGLGATWAHLLGAWAAIVVALAALSRALARDRGSGGDGA